MNLSWRLPVEHLSATSIALAIQCPEKWRRRYVLHEHEKQTGDQFLGLVDHAAHEVNFRQKIETGEDLSLDEIKKTYVDKWTETIDTEGEPDWRDVEPGTMYERGLNAVELYHRVVSPNIFPVAVEQFFEFSVTGIPFPVIGYLDVLTNDRVIDRKTAKNKLSKPKSGWRLQAKIYSYATQRPVEFHVTTKQVTPQIVTGQDSPELILRPPNPIQTELFILQVTRMLNDNFCRYGAGEAWPTLGQTHDWLCFWCRYGPKHSNSCPAWTNGAAQLVA